MDPNSVLYISSDEEPGWDGDDDRVITVGFDDNNWIAELLDEVNGGDCGAGYHDGSDDSDEVVLVSEVLPSRRPRKKPTSKSSSLIELDDECVVLDHDPGKPKEVRNEDPIARSENGDDDSDDLLVVSETGQVACRDYPHPRHLCIKFPFSSTPNESHCDQCYCYVCDSLAPCLYWGNGSGTIDHCQATEKIEFWKLERQNSKNINKLTDVPHMNMASLPLPLPLPLPPLLVQTPTMAHIPVQRPNPIRVCPVSPNLGSPNMINQNRAPFLLSRNKYQPGLVSQQLIRTSSCSIPRDRGHQYHNYTFNRPVFKRTVSPGVASTGNRNRHFYSSHRDRDRDSYSYRNLCRQQDYRMPENSVNSSASFPPSYLPFEEPLLSPDSQPQVNSDSYVESPIPIPFQPQPQLQSALPNYAVPCEEASQQGNHNHGQRSTVDPKFFHGINWPESQANHLPAAQTATPANIDSEELVDYRYDNWSYDTGPCEPNSMEIPGSFGLNEFSPDPAFLDTVN
ncbi:unnamed protein product [Lactuca virosa]|uniref:Uncharacterized protein n=1 Tax=Lactuca virosa TaxID=75947 RepID=A0AAU9MXT5_9ASTR|nr:unnamed protein product [Lactuca virosa]